MDTKQVTVKLDAKQSKPTNTKKNNKSQPDVDLNKEFIRARDEGILRLNLSKNNITIIPPLIKECQHLVELYLYGNKIASLPAEIGNLTQLQTLALNENQVGWIFFFALARERKKLKIILSAMKTDQFYLLLAKLITRYVAEFNKAKSFGSTTQ